MKLRILVGMLSLGSLSISCAHEQVKPRAEPRKVWAHERDALTEWVSYQAELEQMSTKDLRQEVERLRKNPGEARTDENELRVALAQAVMHSEARAYQKALDCLQTQVTRTTLDADLRLWLKQYSQQLAVAVQLDKELSEEKKQRQEVEKKMKALSDIELEMRQRENNEILR